jgi:hypothetical protein
VRSLLKINQIVRTTRLLVIAFIKPGDESDCPMR